MTSPDQQAYTFEQIEQLAAKGNFELSNPTLMTMRQVAKPPEFTPKIVVNFEKQYQFAVNDAAKKRFGIQFNQQ
jgi:hypothetical protein